MAKKKSSSMIFLDEIWDKSLSVYRKVMAIYMVLLFPLGLIYVLIYFLYYNRIYLKIKELRDLGNSKTLLFIAQKESNASLRLLYSLAALVDLRNKDGMKILHDRSKKFCSSNSYYSSSRSRSDPMLHIYELYVSAIEIIGTPYVEKIKSKPSRVAPLNRIPITKVYFLNKKPTDAKCMITKITLDFEKDTIVACPNCGNFAKKVLLQEWLEIKGLCPICKSNIVLNDCPLVMLKPKK